MNTPDLFSKLIEKYFNRDECGEILDYIDSYIIDYEHYFFQIVQDNNSPKIEFSCLNGNSIYDFTYIERRGYTHIIFLKDIKIISIDENIKSMEIALRANLHELYYKASNPIYIEKLKEYSKVVVKYQRESRNA